MSRLPSLRELGEDARAARYYAPGDASDLGEQVLDLVNDEGARRALGDRARQWVERERTWARSIEGTLAAYGAAGAGAALR